jgi:PIN domain nuclease of toxin-antitoxin system
LRLLLDTHVALWAVLGHPKLSTKARRLILSADAEVHVSVVSIWEVGIKRALGRGDVNDMPLSAAAFEANCRVAEYEFLPVTARHALAASDLPLLHRDPFDRMLIAQAQSEPMRLLTVDRVLTTYGGDVELV